MGDIRLRFLKYVLQFSRATFQYKLHNQFSRIHTLPQKAVSQELIFDIKKSETLWRRNKDNYSLNKHLHECFMRNEDVLTYAIDMITCASNHRTSSPEHIFSIVKILDDYVQEHNTDFNPTLVQKNTVLFSVLHYKHHQLIRLVCHVFKICEQAHSFKDVVDDMIQQQKLIEAANCVIALHLQKEFEVDKILIPLLLEGKMQSAVLYMADHPDLQLKVAKLMDQYLQRDSSTSFINPRLVFKMLTSIVNMFKIPLVHCPNLHLIRRKGAINHLLRQRIEQSMSETTWDDMIQTVIGDDEYLQRFLIKKLVFKKNIKTALRLAKFYNIDDPELLLSVSNDDSSENQVDLEDVKPEDLGISCDLGKFENEEKSSNHLEFGLKSEDIVIISNQEDFVKCINEISENYTMIGIDSEWKPRFGLSNDKLALIQLAGHDKVFIFDVLLLLECLEAQDWDKLFDDIFGNPNIIKLGCNIMADVNMILETISGSTGKTIKFSHMLDVALFYQKLQDVYPDKLNKEGEKSTVKGLSSLCDILLGKPLNKEERLCNWELRPLKQSQLEYAAIDAHCLLLMYDKLRDDSIKQNINFDHLAKVAIVLTNSQWKPKRRFKGVKSEKGFHIHSTIAIEHFKVVMDPAFESQGKELRQLGADVIILENGDASVTDLELSKFEGRTIICSDNFWNQIKDKVKEGFCHYFPSTSEDPITVSHFLQHFNVKVTTKNIYTRCTICNSNDGIKLYLEDIKRLQELEDTNESSMNYSIKNNLSCFSSELQVFFTDILNLSVNIKFASQTQTSSFIECAFICKSCGNIS